MAFDQATRNRLQKFVSDARKLLSEEFTQQLQNTYGLDPLTGGIAELSALPSLSPSEQQTATLLRDTLEHYLAASHKAEPHKDKALVIAALDRIVREQAFTVLNRLAALRMAEARQFVMESISQGYQSKGFQLYQRIAGSSLGETGQAYQHYLFSVFDELSLDLAVLFDRYSAQGRLFPRETVLIELLELINHVELEQLWAEDETVGWIYQFWNGREEIDKMRSASRGPRNSREMAVRNQFFTPRYVVEFLTDNTLGRIWYEMTKGKTALVDSCQYLVRRPNEVFLNEGQFSPERESVSTLNFSQEELFQQTQYIKSRPLKDPRDIKMLDPACGSMHFGLYAFDLFEQIYSEAWDIESIKGSEIFFNEEGAIPRAALHETYSTKEDFLADVPRLTIEHNIHGVDIDPRAAQIAGLSLWLRAQKSWSDNAIKPGDRPKILRSNIVCAEPMPGEKQLLKEFTSQIKPSVLGQLVEEIFDKMQLAGEAGTLLKIEKEIQSAIEEAKSQKDENILEVQGGLFGGEKWEAREGKRYYNFGDVSDGFWIEAENLILTQLEQYAESATGNSSGKKRLFARDAAKGFAFIDLCRNKFDVLLMNPPFGMPSKPVDKYIKAKYETGGDVISQFFERIPELCTDNGKSGAITSRAVFFLGSQNKLREEVLFNKIFLNGFVDLGDGVLDAMVETALSLMDQSGASKENAFFIRELLAKDKQSKLLEACNKLNSSERSSSVFISDQTEFKKIESAPVCYWVSKKSINTLAAYDPLEKDNATIRVGLQTGDDFRFLRLTWEVPSASLYTGFSESTDAAITTNRHLQAVSKRWAYYSKTDEAAAWYSPINLVVDWMRDGHQLKANVIHKGYSPSKWVQSEDKYFKPGFSYMLRSSRLVPYIVPKGCIPTAGRSQVFPEVGKEIDVLAICASNLGSAVARFRGEKFGWPKFQAGMIQQLPFSNLSNEVKEAAKSTMLSAIKAAKDYYATDETTLDYVGSPKLTIKYQPATNFKTLLGEDNEIALAKCFGLSKEEYEELQLDLQQAVSLRKGKEELEHTELKTYAAIRHLSWLIGRAFGRWQGSAIAQRTDDIYAELPEQAPAFNWAAKEGKIKESGVADLESSESLIEAVTAIADTEIMEESLLSVGAKDWKDYLGKPSQFFASHYALYSQNRRYAPIYWPLQTPTGSYTIWVYYHNLNEETLYICINDFVEPKLDSIDTDLNELRNKLTRSSDEEKELDQLSDLEVELKNFRDELLNLSRFWKPNLNDGVQITAAPLWKLFQHKAWKKKLKDTWEKLEKGSYDWSHLACSVWPERVLRKCHEDRSIAVVHDVEASLWEEVEVRDGKSKKTKLVWQPKELTESELDAFIQHKITQG